MYGLSISRFLISTLNEHNLGQYLEIAFLTIEIHFFVNTTDEKIYPKLVTPLMSNYSGIFSLTLDISQ